MTGQSAVYDGNMKILLVDDIVDRDAPTLAELELGDDVTSQVRKDGYNPGVTDNRVSDGDLSTLFNAELMGTYGAQVELTFKRKFPIEDDAAWTKLTHLARTNIVVIPFGGLIDGVHCNVFPVEAGQRRPMQSAENEQQAFAVSFAVYEEPSWDALIDGGS